MTTVSHAPDCPAAEGAGKCRCDFMFRLATATGQRYVAFSTPCDISQTSMADAAMHLGPSFEYYVHVNPFQGAWVRQIVRTIGASCMPHPFAPCVSVREDESLERHEWFVTANGKAMGSKGVT